ncbi:hypothetical protein Syun_010891 [Stephania yunnanensis]|uniref:AUGMIN subunit 8 n=1 Tax=Stephania yunnanensis TaxID=152371 RepID=A0AAP0PHZ1_9MAGN
MDVIEVAQAPLLKEGSDETARPPLIPAEKGGVVARKSKPTKDIPSRYKNAISSLPSLSNTHTNVSRRSPSPNLARRPSSPSFPRRTQSVERRRFSIPGSPPRPSTPAHDSPFDANISLRRSVSGRNSEGLWPSTTTIRSLSVSFQSDTFSLQVSKKEKPLNDYSSDHPLRPSANVGRRQAETPTISRKVAPERKRTPLRGRNDATEQSENSRPVDNSIPRNVDQRRKGVAVSANAFTRSFDLNDRGSRFQSLPSPRSRISPLRRVPTSDNLGRSLRKSGSEITSNASVDGNARPEYEMHSIDEAHKLVMSTVGLYSTPSERANSTIRASRTQSLPVPGSLTRAPSPVKAHLTPGPSSGGILSRTRSLTASASASPSVNPSTSRSNTSTSSVLSFIADIKRGKKAANYIEDAHQLRLLHNRYLQWRYANAQAEGVLSIQRVAAETTIYNVWNITAKLRDAVRWKRINLEQLRQELKLNLLLNRHMTYLDNWALMEKEHSSSLAGAFEALKACTLRLPVTGGAKAYLQAVQDAIYSAMNLMHGLSSSASLLLLRMEGMSHLVSELADLAAQGRAMLDECEDLLARTLAMQVEENSLITQIIQLKQAWRNGQLLISAVEVPA